MRFLRKSSDYPLSLEDLLKETVEKKGSDLHIVAGVPPCVRINGELIPCNHPELHSGDIPGLLLPILDDYQVEELETNWELDFSYSIFGCARFRGNIIVQRGTLAAVFRVIPFGIPEIGGLGLPQDVQRLCTLTRGLVLVTGPTGSGKSTTLAAMLNVINNTRRVNIVTVEDPIEFLHPHKLATIRQREIGTDTKSFSNALCQVLRHDPDIIMIGEMRDAESIGIALTAAETGHLVFSTLHTQTAPLTISRIVDAFPDERRVQVRQQLAASLRGVISQQLIPTLSGGREVAVEYMADTPAVKSLIRESKEHQLYSAIQTGQAFGMQTMDQALVKLLRLGKISRLHALEYCVDRNELERLLRS